MNLGKIFRFFKKEDSNEVKQEMDYEKLIKEMKLAKKKHMILKKKIIV